MILVYFFLSEDTCVLFFLSEDTCVLRLFKFFVRWFYSNSFSFADKDFDFSIFFWLEYCVCVNFMS